MALRGSSSQALGQRESLKHGDVFVVGQYKSARLLNFSHHIDNSSSTHSYNIARMDGNIETWVCRL